MKPENPETVRVRKRLLLSGVVQGVFFRDSARALADSLRVAGFVRNLRDGRVEVVAEGESEAVERFVAWCRRGPAAARVEHVEMHEEPFQGEFQDFTIKRTA